MITPFDFQKEAFVHFDLTANNNQLKEIDLSDIEAFNAYIFDSIESQKAKVGLGGWLEKRVVYDNLSQFQGLNQRCYHLGVDIWAKAGTPLFAIEDCSVHSFQYNNHLGDYGPTIILQSIATNLFFLHGHLSLDSLEGLTIGQTIKKGSQFAKIGPYPENGNWPPDLHFQVMNSMEGKQGDFPGVCSAIDLDYFKTICLNPYPFLGIPL